MSAGRGLPLLSGPPPEYSDNEPACRKCNKEFNVIFARSRKCNHCGYSYCNSCSDYQALMPRRSGTDASSTSGYDPMPVCAFCAEMLQITASGKGQLKQLPMAKLKQYAKAYNIDVSGLLEKDEFIDRLIATRGPNGCLPRQKEIYYRKYSVPHRANNRPRGLFSRAMDAMSGERSSSETPPPPPPRQPQQGYPGAQYQRPRTASGPSSYQQQPRPANPHVHNQGYAPAYGPPPGHRYAPGYMPGYAPQYPSHPPHPPQAQHSRPGNLNVPQTGTSRPRAASTSSPSTSRGPSPSPARPVVAPSIDELLGMSEAQVSALSVGTLKEILFKNHVTARMVVEKSELVARVQTLLQQERAERARKAAEEEAERAAEEEARREREEARQRERERAARQARVEDAVDEGEGTGTEGVGTTGMTQSTPGPRQESVRTPPPTSPPSASTMTPKAQAMATRLERTGLCVICQDEEANIAIVDCGHLAMCRPCSDLIMQSTRECPLCRTRIVTESRLLRIFKS